MITTEATPGRPTYSKQQAEPPSTLWFVNCDEGWRLSIVCTGMYEWAADWLIEQVQGKPYAPGGRP